MYFDADTCTVVLTEAEKSVKEWIVPGQQSPQKFEGVLLAVDRVRDGYTNGVPRAQQTREHLNAETNKFLAKVVPAVTYITATHTINI